jgi:hypothetical protein
VDEQLRGGSVSRSLPHTVSSPLLLLMQRSENSTTEEQQLTIENSLIGSRVPLIPKSISGRVVQFLAVKSQPMLREKKVPVHVFLYQRPTVHI